MTMAALIPPPARAAWFHLSLQLLQIGRYIESTLIAGLAVLLDCFIDNAFDLRRNSRIQIPDRLPDSRSGSPDEAPERCLQRRHAAALPFHKEPDQRKKDLCVYLTSHHVLAPATCTLRSQPLCQCGLVSRVDSILAQDAGCVD